MKSTTLSPKRGIFAIATCIAGLASAASPSQLNVSFPAANLELEGTLRLPSSDLWPVPGVVLIHGSGPLSRDEIMRGQLGLGFGFPIPVFRNIGDALQEKGIAVLTYDKRECGTFNGCASNSYPYPINDMTIDVFLDDALAAVDFLKGREEVENVTVVGHSQSGPFIPIMLEADPELVSGIMLAGPFRSVDEMLEYQLNFLISLVGNFGVSEAEALANPQVLQVAQRVKGVDDVLGGTSNETVGGYSAAYWRSWFDLADQAKQSAANISQPMLLINGELDWNVPSTEAESWSEYLTQVGVTHDVEILPCVTHACNCVSESDPTKITVDNFGREVAPEVTDAITQFVLQDCSDVTSGGAMPLCVRAMLTTLCTSIVFELLSGT